MSTPATRLIVLSPAAENWRQKPKDSAPFALVRTRVSQIWAAGAFGMRWGIYFIMDILFRYQMAGLIFLPFFPIERLIPLGSGASGRLRAALTRGTHRRSPAEGHS